HAILSNKVMIVSNALSDSRFRDNPLVSGEPHIRAYAGAPLTTATGKKLGTLCVLDTKPRRFTSHHQKLLADLAIIVMDELNLRLTARELRESDRERRVDLAKSQIEILQRLARAAEYRDDDTGQHTQRVACTVALLGKALGFSIEKIDMMQQAAPLHDVGKISVSDIILLKPGKLTDEEFKIMQNHAAVGAKLLSEGRSAVVKMAELIAGAHHERFDGNGYPNGLFGEQIPIEARILAVADVFDALTHERPYKKPWPIAEAVAEIKHQSGRQFDPRVVNAFLRLDHEALI
ncbi:MAG: HD domain-containing protein, partial [Proteobacteria bacterium]